jgi:hypothetical protein
MKNKKINFPSVKMHQKKSTNKKDALKTTFGAFSRKNPEDFLNHHSIL